MKADVRQKLWPGCACCTRKLFGHEIEMGMCPDCAAQFEIMPQLDGPDNPMTTNEQAGGESRDLDLSQFEGMTLPKAAEEAAWTTRDMLDASQEVIISSVAKSLWPFFEPLIAEVKRLREENAALKRKLRTAMQTIDELNQAYIDDNI